MVERDLTEYWLNKVAMCHVPARVGEITVKWEIWSNGILRFQENSDTLIELYNWYPKDMSYIPFLLLRYAKIIRFCSLTVYIVHWEKKL